jgi:hypothetical protein
MVNVMPVVVIIIVIIICVSCLSLISSLAGGGYYMYNKTKYYGPNKNIFQDADCKPIISYPNGTSLKDCKAKCDADPKCTAINWGEVGDGKFNCGLRECTEGTQPTWVIGVPNKQNYNVTPEMKFNAYAKYEI